MLTYRAAVSRLLGLVDHERGAAASAAPVAAVSGEPVAAGRYLPRQRRIYDLRGIGRLLERLGNPERRAGIVHIAGTKGKGSTAAMVESILRAGGHRTGFYSSPHLHSFCERIRRDGRPVSEGRFAALTAAVWPHHLANADEAGIGPATLFEYLTAMGLLCFAEDDADASVVEVGLGGRLDATNVVTPAVCVITPVSLDHTAILGDTIGEIAAEKAGIIKAGVPVVMAPQFGEAEDTIAAAAAQRGAPLLRAGELARWQAAAVPYEGQDLRIETGNHRYEVRLPLLGDFQSGNAAVAAVTAEALAAAGFRTGPAAVQAGLESVAWPGRLEVLGRSPAVVADGAHNDHSVGALLDTLGVYAPHRRLCVVAGFSRDKRVADMVGLLAARAQRVVATRSRHPRSMAAGEVAAAFRAQGFPSGRLAAADDVAGAMELALAGSDGDTLTLVTGSLFVAAEAREAMLGMAGETYPELLPADLRRPV